MITSSLNQGSSPLHLKVGRTSRTNRAFSLVEVTIAVGLVAFCLVALMGVIPVGLKSEQSSNEQLRAAQLLNNIRQDINSITRPSDTNSVSTITQLTTSRFQIPLTIGGNGSTDQFAVNESLERITQSGRYVVHYEYPSVTSACKPYQIRVIVAWPGVAKFSGHDSSLTLDKAQGFVESLMVVNRL